MLLLYLSFIINSREINISLRFSRNIELFNSSRCLYKIKIIILLLIRNTYHFMCLHVTFWFFCCSINCSKILMRYICRLISIIWHHWALLMGLNNLFGCFINLTLCYTWTWRDFIIIIVYWFVIWWYFCILLFHLFMRKFERWWSYLSYVISLIFRRITCILDAFLYIMNHTLNFRF